MLIEHTLIGIKDWSLIPVASNVDSALYGSTYKALFTGWETIHVFLNKDPEKNQTINKNLWLAPDPPEL